MFLLFFVNLFTLIRKLNTVPSNDPTGNNTKNYNDRSERILSFIREVKADEVDRIFYKNRKWVVKLILTDTNFVFYCDKHFI